jgi:hypothetical protein
MDHSRPVELFGLIAFQKKLAAFCASIMSAQDCSCSKRTHDVLRIRRHLSPENHLCRDLCNRGSTGPDVTLVS